MEEIILTKEKHQGLVNCGCPEALMLYVYLRFGGVREMAFSALYLSPSRGAEAIRCLKELGLWEEVDGSSPKTNESSTKKASPARKERESAVWSEPEMSFCTYSEPATQKAQTKPTVPATTSKKQGVDTIDRTAESEISVVSEPDRASFASTFSQSYIQELKKRVEKMTKPNERSIQAFLENTTLPVETLVGLLGLADKINSFTGELLHPNELIDIMKEWQDAEIISSEMLKAAVQKKEKIYRTVAEYCKMFGCRYRNADLSATVREYMRSWAEFGYDVKAIQVVRERSIERTQIDHNYSYMNAIIVKWMDGGILTVQDIQSKDPEWKELRKKRKNNKSEGGTNNKNDIFQTHTKTTLTPLERLAVVSALEDG